MRTLVISFFLLCCNLSFVASQGTTSTRPADTASVIRNIRKQYLLINSKLTIYQKKERDMSGKSAEGGTVTGYYDQTFLIKASTVFYGEMGKVETDYYFNKEGLFFQYKKNIYYDMPMYLKESKVKKTEETRLYFHKNKMIRWVFNNTVKPAGSKEFKELDLSTKVEVKEARLALKR